MKKYSFLFLILIFSGTAAAYTKITSSNGLSPKWLSMPIPYWINDRGSSQISNGSEFEAIHASFQTWQGVAAADLRFDYRGTTPLRTVGRDGFNIISFGDESSQSLLGSSTIAATFSFFGTNQGQYVFEEADIIFNPVLQFSTSGEEGKFDIQSVLTHEIGHMIGLDHSGLVSSVMVPFAADSQMDQRKLAYDDIAGVVEIYPNMSSSPSVGQIRGTIQSSTIRVFGAHVVAVDDQGTPVVSTISQPDGSYAIRFLPPGTYRVFVEPLDRPVTEENIGGGSNSFYRSLRTDFGTTYFGNVATLEEARTVNVTANAIASADIQTLPRSTSGLNITTPGFAPRVGRGKSGTLFLGGRDITSGLVISASNSELLLGPPTFRLRNSTSAPTTAELELSVPPSAPLGPKSMAVSRGTNTSIIAGGVVITDFRPSGISVVPATGPVQGGTSVTVSGENFRSGAQVYFGGLPAREVRFAGPATLQVTTPSNSPGPMNVVVMNADGTSGVASRAFTYESAPPVISRVFPLSGSPTTIVTIEGENFDTRTQNIDVRFNGVSARVVSAASNVITTAVPYGVPSGPVTVVVFGRSAIGPNFTVIPPAASTNLAVSSFNFIDASAAGGGTNLSFISPDDAIAFFTLPFTFSLFRDIYLSGSRISISTNGWISLDAVSTAEFQNTSLPAQTVIRPGGSTRPVPPSLIAAFWDDLFLKAGSVVSARTVGSAPNRRFVVQWANLSILDEEGNDLNANLTFEMILFEGSNDIQFLYRTMSGPRSDGSSATIGAQDLKRTTGIQSGFNQPIISNGYLTTYRFRDGGYTVETPDLSPPARPVVTDGGALTSSRTELSASWTSSDAESGIREYQYAIGTTPGGFDIRPFTSTTQASVVVTGLNLQLGVTYYFAVRAVNGMGLSSEVGVSDGIRLDPAFTPQVKVIPFAPQNNNEFTGIALLAPTAMSVVFKALDSTGAVVNGNGVRNPTTVTLAAGQQYARLVTEIFGLSTFDGWIELEASGTGLGVFTATGSWDMTRIDGTVARETSADFVLFHAGANAVLVNPSTRPANVTMTNLTSSTVQSLTIPARGRSVVAVPGIVRVRSSEALVAVERTSTSVKEAFNAGVAISEAASTLVFPHAVVGGGYTSMVTLVNVMNTPLDVTITCGTSTGRLRLEANAAVRFSVADFLQIATDVIRVGSLTVSANVPIFGSSAGTLVGVMDIENSSGLVTMGARPAATEFLFPHVAHGNGLFTGLAFATGSRAANITIDIYDAGGGTPRSRTITLDGNQQLGRLINELVPSVTTQMGGYIRVRSDQPIWSWEIYGSGLVMASGPPL